MQMTDNHKGTIRLLQARTIEDESVQRALDALHEATGEEEWEQALAALRAALAPPEQAKRPGLSWPGCGQ